MLTGNHGSAKKGFQWGAAFDQYWSDRDDIEFAQNLPGGKRGNQLKDLLAYMLNNQMGTARSRAAAKALINDARGVNFRDLGVDGPEGYATVDRYVVFNTNTWKSSSGAKRVNLAAHEGSHLIGWDDPAEKKATYALDYWFFSFEQSLFGWKNADIYGDDVENHMSKWVGD